MLVIAEFTFGGREVITKEVTQTGTGARVFVPKDFLRKEIAISRFDKD
jgi:hypothetical protein